FLRPGAVVRNVNFLGVIGKDRVSVVSNWNEGLVENIYVEMNYVFTAASGNKNNGNPGGVIVAKNRASGIVRNSIAVLKAVEGANLTFLGGVVGQNAGNIQNSQLITALGVNLIYVNTGTIVVSEKYPDLAAFYTNVNLEAYGDDWTFIEGLLPHLGTFSEDFAVNNGDLYSASSLVLNIASNYGYLLSLKEIVEGITLDGHTLTASSEVLAGTKVTVVITSLYTDKVLEVEITVLENSYEVSEYQEVYEFDFIREISEEALYKATPVITILYNGNPWSGILTAESANEAIARYEDGKIVAVGDGSTTITFFADGIMVTKVTINSIMYNPVRTVSELEAVGASANSLSQKYILMNDIDVNGTLKTIAHYNDGYQSMTNGFKGIFDGNGYKIMNFSAVYSNPATVANCSLFGTVASSGIIKNLNVINVTVDKRISGGIATINYGTIENCFVDVLFTYSTSSDHNNPMGGLASKNYGSISNSIVVLRVKYGISTVNIGSIAGRAYADSVITNCYAISPLGLFESATPTNGGIDDGNTENSAAYATLEEFYLNADLESFNDDWTFTEGLFPHLGTFSEEIVLLNDNKNLYLDIPYLLELEHNYQVSISLKDSIEGVTLTGNSVNATVLVPVGSKVIVVVSSLYTDTILEVELTVFESPYEVESYQEDYVFDFIKGLSEEALYKQDLVISITYNGEAWSGELTGLSSNSEIAILENGKVVALGDGVALIGIYAGAILLATINVESIMYNPVYTNEEFLAIGTNLETLSAKYILMNDLDFNNAKINAFSSWKTFNSDSKLAFSGVFDGNNYSIKNFEPIYNTTDSSDRDISLFGFLRPGAVVRNVNFLGVIGNDRVSVVSNWNEGLVENIYVEMNYVFTAAPGNKNNGNPGGVIVAKNRASGTVRNSIAVLKAVEGANLTFLGGVVGQNAGAINNCQLITALEVNLTYANTGTLVDSEKYPDLADFYTTANLEAYGDNWTFGEGFLPHLGIFSEDYEVENEVLEIAQNSSLALLVSSKYGHSLELKAAQEGVTLVGSDLSTLDVAIGTQIIVLVKSPNVSVVEEITITVIE
ncbi:MAG: hypothetical protein PHX62_05820, partial [Bacilli bacterium]|nr:hypothetical protein [Bacilli bacterium]